MTYKGLYKCIHPKILQITQKNYVMVDVFLKILSKFMKVSSVVFGYPTITDI